jgi:hypothetical protein
MDWETRLLKPIHWQLDHFHNTILPFIPLLTPAGVGGLPCAEAYHMARSTIRLFTDCIGENLRGPGAMAEYHHTGPFAMQLCEIADSTEPDSAALP